MNTKLTQEQEIPDKAYEGTKETISIGAMGTEIEPGTVKFLLDHNEPLRQFAELLSGGYIDPETGKFIQIGKPLMNEAGKRRVLQDLSLHYNHMFETANMEEDLVIRMTHEFGNEMMLVLTTHQDEYEIDPVELIPIVKLMTRGVYTTLNKSQEGGFQTFLKNSFKTIEHQTQKKTGLVGSLFGSRQST